MIIELPQEFSMDTQKNGQKAYVENNILKITRQVNFREVMVEIVYQMKGREECSYCKRKITKEKMTIDHMFPVDFGGPTITDNIVPACKKCNNEKGNMTYNQYMTFLEARESGSESEYLASLRQYQEKIRKNKLYQIPREWISQKNITDIITTIDLDDDYKSKKYRKIEKYYLDYGIIKKPIIVDKNSFLLDGFLSMMFAKNHNISAVPTIVLDNVEVIL